MKIGILTAMSVEFRQVAAMLCETESIQHGPQQYLTGTLGRNQIVLLQCGIGKVNAAACAQILADCFEVTHILNTGIAGSLDDAIDIGDIVVSTDALQHDMDATPFGYEAGQVPGLSVMAFPADEAFRAMAVEAVRTAAPDVKVFEGRVVSGDQFISSQEKKDAIKAAFGGLCTEMEGAAIAQTAWLNHIPFVILRSISDKANDDAGRAYSEIEAEAAAHCSAVTASIIEHF